MLTDFDKLQNFGCFLNYRIQVHCRHKIYIKISHNNTRPINLMQSQEMDVVIKKDSKLFKFLYKILSENTTYTKCLKMASNVRSRRNNACSMTGHILFNLNIGEIGFILWQFLKTFHLLSVKITCHTIRLRSL